MSLQSDRNKKPPREPLSKKTLTVIAAIAVAVLVFVIVVAISNNVPLL